MKRKYSYLALMATVFLVSCTSKQEAGERVKVASASSAVQTTNTRPATSTPVSETTQSEAKVLSRLDKALSQLETTDRLEGQEVVAMEERFKEFLGFLQESSSLDDTPGQMDYLLDKNLVYDFKVDYLNRGFQLSELVSVKSHSADVWQAVVVLKNPSDEEAYYAVHYNTFLEKFIFFYRDSTPDETVGGE